ncbi:MAG: FtsX-like permease family protein [Chloroflexi bacterium]|nr:FtsX-like permease family protein [Chloroflexota bacterium]
MTFANTLRTALRGVTANKLRATLTALGLIIGVASVIVMLALGNGARAAVEENFRFLGSNQIQISARQELDDGEIVPVGEILSYEDGLLLPGAIELVDRVEMWVQGIGKVRHERVVLDMSIVGVTADALLELTSGAELQPADWPEGERLTPDAFIGQGRFFTRAEVLASADVCVLGYDTAEDLFEGDDPIGATVWVSRHRCLVTGVLAELDTIDSEERHRSEPNEAFFMPISTAVGTLYDEEPTVSVTAHATDESRMGEARLQIATYLRQRHSIDKDVEGEYDDDFTTTTRGDILGAQQESARVFALFLAAMAVVSLVVGGIGIMNVMLVSVTERTQEIGIRLAVGARGRDVVAQFLCESVLLSAGGGVMGIAVGILLIPLVAMFNQGNALLDSGSIPLAFGVALLTGLLFGLYPAVRASRLHPIEALRYE